MRDWTWPSTVIFGLIIAAIVILFALTEDAEMRKQLIGYLDTIVGFIVGAATGAAVGATIAYAKAKNLW